MFYGRGNRFVQTRAFDKEVERLKRRFFWAGFRYGFIVALAIIWGVLQVWG